MEKSRIEKSFFGCLPDGTPVTRFILTNQQGMSLGVLDYGCTITSLMVPDRHGVLGDVVLGFDSLDGYLTSPHYMGCIIGRCAGRIAHGSFDIDGTTYALATNQSPHHLHGGMQGFDTKQWHAEPYQQHDGAGIVLHYLSPDGEEGYPGHLSVQVTYFLSHDNSLLFHYTAHCDRPTIVNLTQHTYFHLNGGQDTILKHGLAINAGQVLPIDATKIPSGLLQPVDHTVFDFRNPKLLGQVLLQDDPQLRLARGIDHCWVIRPGEKPLSHATILMEMASGRRMDVFTTEPGLQVYTGNYLEGVGKKGVVYGAYSGIALETQHFPDAIHHPGFPSVLVRPGERYESVTWLRFSRISQAG